MHENTRSRTATASGGTPSLAREEADDEAAALIRQADGDTTGAGHVVVWFAGWLCVLAKRFGPGAGSRCRHHLLGESMWIAVGPSATS